MGNILLYFGLLFLISMAWACLVFLVGYPFKRLFKLPKTFATDATILILLYLINPLGVFDPLFDGFYDISVLWDSALYLPFAVAAIYLVHQGEE